MFVFFYLLKIDARFILYYFYFYFYLISTLLVFLQYICNSNKVLAQKLWSQYKSSLIYKDGLHVFFSIIYQIKKHSLSIIMCVYICLHHCRGYFQKLDKADLETSPRNVLLVPIYMPAQCTLFIIIVMYFNSPK